MREGIREREKPALLIIPLVLALLFALSKPGVTGNNYNDESFKEINRKLRFLLDDQLQPQEHLRFSTMEDLRGTYLAIVLKYGSLDEPQELRGFRWVLKALLERSDEYEELRKEIEVSGGDLKIQVEDDYVLMNLKAPKERDKLIRKFLNLLKSLIEDPSPLLKYKERVRDVKIQAEISPLERYIREEIYGPHPYNALVKPNPEVINEEKLRKGVREVFCQKRFFAALLSNDITSDLREALKSLYDELPQCPENNYIFPHWELKNSFIKRRFIRSDDSYVVIVYSAPQPLSKDFLSMMLVDELIAGSFQSMLMKVLREEEGRIYSASHELKPMLGGGYYVISIAVPNSSLSPLIRSLNDLLTVESLKAWVEKVYKENQLKYFKERLYWKYLLATSDPSVLSNYYALEMAIGYYWTPPERLRSLLEEVTVRDLLKVIDEHMRHKLLIILEGVSPENRAR